MHKQDDQKVIRALFIGDSHADDLAPISRKDNYMHAVAQDIRGALRIGRDLEVDYAVHLGDIFNRLDPNVLCRNMIAEMFAGDEDGSSWAFPIYAVGGNHDFKSNPQNLPKSALQTLISAKLVRYVDCVHEFGISFGHYTPRIEEHIAMGSLLEQDPVIWALHANITINPFFEGASYIQLQDIPANPACRLIVAGHIHFPMEGERPDGLRYINPGALTRNSLKKENLERLPQVLLVKYTRDGSYLETSYITVPTAAPACDIFKIEESLAKKDRAHDSKQFVKQVTQLRTKVGGDDIIRSLRHSGQIKGLEKPVLDRAVNMVQMVKQTHDEEED